MKIAVLGQTGSWYAADLARAALARGHRLDLIPLSNWGAGLQRRGDGVRGGAGTAELRRGDRPDDASRFAGAGGGADGFRRGWKAGACGSSILPRRLSVPSTNT
ncbi:MAG: hypothetical protein U0903_11385 [Planctomycetales bacterium]